MVKIFHTSCWEGSYTLTQEISCCFRCAIEEPKDLSQISIDDLMGLLLSHESKMNRYERSLLKIAFKFHVFVSRSRGRERTRGIGRGNISDDQWNGKED